MSKTTLKINQPKNVLIGAIALSIVATLTQVILTVYAIFKVSQKQAPPSDPVSQQLQTIRNAYDKLDNETVN